MSAPDALRVVVATFGRSDFAILRPLCSLLQSDPGFDFGLFVAGAHFEDVSGGTVSDIEASGLPVWARLDCGVYDRSEGGTARVMSAHMSGLADILDEVGAGNTPDLMIVLGDRFEAAATGLACVALGLPVAHISGGSITEGAIDDTFRHCLTKVGVLHFCDLPEFAQRIHRMGERTDRIVTTGALGLDAFVAAPTRSLDDLADRFDLTGIRPGYLLVTVHPESRSPQETGPLIRAVIEAVTADPDGRDVVFTYPNADPGSDEIVAALEALRTREHVFVVRSFGADWFPTAMRHAGVLVGNSSGGIIEAASFGLPVVDVGDRQKGRNAGPNVVHCARDRASIAAAVRDVSEPRFAGRVSDNIYGDGRGAERVMHTLRTVEPSTLRTPKPFAPYDPSFTGDMLELP